MSGFLTRINLLTTESGVVGTCSSFLSLIVRVMSKGGAKNFSCPGLLNKHINIF